MNFSELQALSHRYLEAKYQTYHRQLQISFFEHRLSILLGERGVGKTTLMIQYLLHTVQQQALSPLILYIPCDHVLLGACSLYDIAEHFYQLGGKIIAFDEIHTHTHWSKELKSIYDTFPDLKIIASGSSALAIYQGTHDLSRRAITQELHGLSLREYLELEHNISLVSYSLSDILEKHSMIGRDIIKILNQKSLKILPEFQKYLQIGYYPYARELKDPNLYWMTLEQNIRTTLESDLVAIFPTLTGTSIRKLKHLLSFIASAVPFVPNLHKLKQILHIGDERTLKIYLKYLEDARLIRQLKSASSKLNQLESPEKIYLHNTNQLYALSKLSENIGTVRELFFLSMMTHSHQVTAPKQGDFCVDQTFFFEIGGKKKTGSQLDPKNLAYVVCDDLELGTAQKIPLWLFGFVY